MAVPHSPADVAEPAEQHTDGEHHNINLHNKTPEDRVSKSKSAAEWDKKSGGKVSQAEGSAKVRRELRQAAEGLGMGPMQLRKAGGLEHAEPGGGGLSREGETVRKAEQ